MSGGFNSDLTPVRGRGRLLFHEALGRGGYGEVYRCTWIREGGIEHVVAVKVLNASVARGSDAQRRLKDEARLLGALTHPGVVRVYDLVEIRGNVAMIAEFVDGHDLDRCVLDGLPPRALVQVVGQVAAALGAAWSDISPITGRPLRLVHRDCKPENVRITPHGDVKILDFGVARAAEMRREAQTATNTVMGSYRYMAPERFDADQEPHPSLDVFALGCILYEGLAYRRLFEHLSMREMLVLSLPGTDRYEAYIEERFAELPTSADPDLIELIRRLVDRDPSRRPMPQRLATLCDDLADGMEGDTLRQWCRARSWPSGDVGPGEWSGMQFQIEPSTSGGFALPGLGDSDYPSATEFPTDGPGTSDATLPGIQRFDPVAVPDEPMFAPRDLAQDELTNPTGSLLPGADDPTDRRLGQRVLDPSDEVPDPVVRPPEPPDPEDDVPDAPTDIAEPPQVSEPLTADVLVAAVPDPDPRDLDSPVTAELDLDDLRQQDEDTPDPEGVATVSVDMDKVRESVAREIARRTAAREAPVPVVSGPAPDEDATRELAPHEFDTMRQKVPEEVKAQAPTPRRRRSLADRAPAPGSSAAPAPVRSSAPAPTPVVEPEPPVAESSVGAKEPEQDADPSVPPEPEPEAPEPEAPLRAPAGPEIHREAHEARMREAEAEAARAAAEERAERLMPPLVTTGSIVANIALIAMLGVVGLATLLAWLVFA